MKLDVRHNVLAHKERIKTLELFPYLKDLCARGRPLESSFLRMKREACPLTRARHFREHPRELVRLPLQLREVYAARLSVEPNDPERAPASCAADVPKPVSSCPPKKTIMNFVREVEAFARDDEKFCVGLEQQTALITLGSFVDPSGTPVKTLGENLESILDMKQSAACGGLLPIYHFLCEFF